MSNTLRRSLLSIAFPLIFTAPVMATDGYFASGFGVKQQGQGGAGVALTDSIDNVLGRGGGGGGLVAHEGAPCQ